MKTKRHAVCAALAVLGGFAAAFADGAGGVVTNEMPDGSTLYTFKESGTFVPPAGGSAEVLLVGGGGGGNAGGSSPFSVGAGGGAGGVLHLEDIA